ncbi:alpha/beta hydrolase [Natranaerobius thermophilus]|uniref:Alpha/beta hydrolase fold-5 domain-containing protein n=1 Tax=Natranaerobius thermophilus (strain ATCC BAA-1301 / DSM 18059 / JW/NM-WN-LF) TaxID=457570 RepID=B2A7I3_NATTJ|nr:alpha/beta hydrolase [Natranaerobius thermophilus]ACB85692.1 conserved hypothetical protein [Natranaerobius thermophilus JW/NM-WN-LF]
MAKFFGGGKGKAVKKKLTNNKFKIVSLTFIGIVVILAGLFGFWLSMGPELLPEAYAALHQDEQVQVTEGENWLDFTPKGQSPDTAVILYPGGRLKPEAYAPLARNLALEGYRIFLVSMPFDLSFFGYDRADTIISEHSDIQRWYIGGHSLGGAMAARYINQKNTREVDLDGLILMASYPDESDDLSDHNIRAMSIYADRDGYVTEEDISTSKDLLPAETEYVEISGGNHSQFGWYEQQREDLDPKISLEKQQQIVLDSILEFLDN